MHATFYPHHKKTSPYPYDMKRVCHMGHIQNANAN